MLFGPFFILDPRPRPSPLSQELLSTSRLNSSGYSTFGMWPQRSKTCRRAPGILPAASKAWLTAGCGPGGPENERWGGDRAEPLPDRLQDPGACAPECGRSFACN